MKHRVQGAVKKYLMKTSVSCNNVSAECWNIYEIVFFVVFLFVTVYFY